MNPLDGEDLDKEGGLERALAREMLIQARTLSTEPGKGVWQQHWKQFVTLLGGERLPSAKGTHMQLLT